MWGSHNGSGAGRCSDTNFGSQVRYFGLQTHSSLAHSAPGPEALCLGHNGRCLCNSVRSETSTESALPPELRNGLVADGAAASTPSFWSLPMMRKWCVSSSEEAASRDPLCLSRGTSSRSSAESSQARKAGSGCRGGKAHFGRLRPRSFVSQTSHKNRQIRPCVTSSKITKALQINIFS